MSNSPGRDSPAGPSRQVLAAITAMILLVGGAVAITLVRSAPDGRPASTATDPWDRLNNGCEVSARGVPACGALAGAAYGANTDPTEWERSMGHHLGIHRSYFDADEVASAVTIAKDDLSKGRIPWISFKLPLPWQEMASGAGDTWVKDLAERLAGLPGPVWVALHHEPEGDGNISAWTAMQERLAPLMRGTAPNLAFTVVLTGWNNLHGAREFRLDRIWPDTTVDLAGFDVYEKYGVHAGDDEYTDFTAYFEAFRRFSAQRGMAWGLAETGYSARAAADDPGWLQSTYDQLTTAGGVAFTYFNSTLNSVTDWTLDRDDKQQAFARLVAAAPTF